MQLFPVNEPERLQALACYQLLDTPPEPAFDRITALACRVFDVPVALIPLIDLDRQWFKSKHGVSVSETPRSIAFCNHTIARDGVLVVPDTTQDGRFAGSPLVTGAPHVRFYAGAPLTTADGHRIGSLCVIDYKPRTFTAAQAATLEDLAATVVELIEARRANANLMAQTAERQQVEDALRETKARKAAILDAALDGIISIDHEGTVLQLNPAAERMFGYPAADAVGREMAELIIPPAFRAAHRRGMAHFLATGEGPALNQHLELSAMRADGTEFPVELVITRIAGDGPPVFTGHIRDITARKRSQQEVEDSHHLLRSVIDGTDNIIFIKNRELQYLMINPAGAAILGSTPEEVVGKDDHAFFPRESALEIQAFDHEILRTDRSLTYESSDTIAGVERVFLSTKSPYRDAAGNLVGVIGIVREITAQRRAAEAENRAKEEAEKANRAKSEFLSRMSHELRTPLNAILGFGQLLEIGDLGGRQNESVAHILKAGRHLLNLIDEVLSISRIEAGKLNLSLEPVAVAGMLTECLDLVKLQASERGVVCRAEKREDACGQERCVRADRQRLRQILLNLLSNAIKYNRPEGTVGISCRVLPAADGQKERVRMEVSDTGLGLTAEEIERLFTPFERLKASRSTTEGTGLGLALSKSLVEAMGGRIGVESVPEVGSTFWVELPSELSRLEELDHPAIWPLYDLADVEEQGGATILYVEDNLSNFCLIEMLLEGWPKVNLLSAEQGTLGIELARARQPDLILLDLHLPDLPGWEVLERLRDDECTRDIPIVIISADATPGQVSRLLTAGANGYLTKPINVQELLKIIREYVPRNRALAAARSGA